MIVLASDQCCLYRQGAVIATWLQVKGQAQAAVVAKVVLAGVWSLSFY